MIALWDRLDPNRLGGRRLHSQGTIMRSVLRLRIRGRLYLLVGIFALGCAAIAGTLVWLQSTKQTDARIRQLEALVDAAFGALDNSKALSDSGTISEDEARKRALSIIGSMR